MEAKKALRKQFLQRRLALSEAEVSKRSQEIFERWRELFNPRQHRAVHTFLPVKKLREVDTSLFTDFLKRRHPQVKIAVPRVNQGCPDLSHHEYCPEELTISSWGIAEPAETAPRLEPDFFDLILVPMLAFDDEGTRLGYGAGYYDRFLAQTRTDCLKVGLCFEFNRYPEGLPKNQFDQPLDLVITEKKAYCFRKNQ